jgi:hypothetical protein
VWHRATGHASFSFRSGLQPRLSLSLSLFLSLSLSLYGSDIILGISSSVLNDIKHADEKDAAILMLVTRVHSESFPSFLSLMSVDDEFF